MSDIDNKMIVEKKVKFSESMLWDLQRKYFAEEGVNAWAGSVPFYITSNLFIANSYAEVFIRYVQDCKNRGKVLKDKPFYIFELGTGSGRFSYYCARQIFTLQKELGLEDIEIIYVMTDFTDSNVKFWRTQRELQPLVEAGKVDFAIFDLENSETLEMINSGVVLDGSDDNNPISVFGNYIFDTVTQDVFRVEKGEVLESRISLVADKTNVENKRPKKLEDLDMLHTYYNITSGYYEDEILNEMLRGYKKDLNEGTFLMPLGGFRCLKNLFKISNNKCLLISTDKSYARLDEIEGRGDPALVCHGSFSMTVNFHALGEYFRLSGGSVRHQKIRESIKTSCFVLGDDFDDLPETSSAIKYHVDTCGPGDFFIYHRFLVDNKEQAHLTALVAHLNVSLWDPHFFKLMIDRIIEVSKTAEKIELQGLLDGTKEVIDNIYLMPGAHDTYFDVGLLHHAVDQPLKAIEYYEQSREYFGENFSLLYNMALCQYAAGNNDKARELFEQAKTMNPDSTDVDEWMKRLDGGSDDSSGEQGSDTLNELE